MNQSSFNQIDTIYRLWEEDKSAATNLEIKKLDDHIDIKYQFLHKKSEEGGLTFERERGCEDEEVVLYKECDNWVTSFYFIYIVGFIMILLFRPFQWALPGQLVRFSNRLAFFTAHRSSNYPVQVAVGIQVVNKN